MEKSTEELINELQAATDIIKFAEENKDELDAVTLSEQLDDFLKEYKKSKSDIIRDAGIDTTYGYQIFDGKKKPRRDKLLQLAFGFPLTVEQTNILLRAGGMSDLYVRSKRDAICMYCLQQRMLVNECNDMLFKAGEDTFQ
jgi:hypothetical protein